MVYLTSEGILSIKIGYLYSFIILMCVCIYIFPFLVSLAVSSSFSSAYRHNSAYLVFKRKKNPYPALILYTFLHCHILSLIFIATLLYMCFLQLFPSTLMNPFRTCFLHPPCSNKIALVKITNDFHVAKSNGQFSVSIIFGLSVNLFPLVRTLPSLDSCISTL